MTGAPSAREIAELRDASPRARRGLGDLLRWGLIALLLGHGIFYTIGELREQTELRRLVATGIGVASTPQDRLIASTAMAFNIPTHWRVEIDYGLHHPLMKLLRPSAYQVYRCGGHCAKRSRLLVELLRIQGIPARKLFLYNEPEPGLVAEPLQSWVHVVVEAKIDGRWVVADPLFNLVFRSADGRPLTAEDLARDREILARWREQADERFDVWEDEVYFYDDLRRFPWFVVPVVGERVRLALVRLYGARTVDSWATPGWMERPYLQIAVGSYAVALLLWVAPYCRRRHPR